MPRKYTSVATKKKKDIDPETLKKALNDLKTGLSLRKCSEKHNVALTTLHRHVKSGSNLKKRGGQTVLTAEEEAVLVDRLKICSDWGYPVDSLTLRLIVKDSLEKQGKQVRKFKNNTPGPDFVESFLKRHKEVLSSRMCQNIKRSRAAVSPEIINAYFDELEKELKDVPPSHIINYDETNLCDDPGKRKLIFRRGCKYPERVINSSKASTSVMFAATADGKILPPYVVYKAQHLYDSWRERGPKNSRYNRTKSGWFDSFCFSDWVESTAIQFLKHLEGPKFLIGDNLSSHLSVDVIKLCTDNQIRFIFLPSNSTHLTQPLDVAFFRPMKIAWRQILEEWKKESGKGEASVPKDKFPALLKKLCDKFDEKNVLSGFRKCGIVPLCRQKVLDMLPGIDDTRSTGTGTSAGDNTPSSVPRIEAIDDSFKELLRSLRQYDTPQIRKKRTKVNVTPGKSVEVKDFEHPAGADTYRDQAGPSGASTQTNGKPKASKLIKKSTKGLLHESSSEDDSDYSIQDSDKAFRLSTTSEEDFECEATENLQIPNDFFPEDFLVVKVHGEKGKTFRLYVIKVLYPEDEGYVGVFYKMVPHTWKFSETNEEASFLPQDVVRKLQPSDNIKTSSRFKNMMSFKNDMTDLNLY